MNSRPSMVLSQTVIASGEFEPQSALLFMSLIEQKKTLLDRLNKAREDRFFDKKSVGKVGLDDINISDLDLSKTEMEEIKFINTASWLSVVESCYSYDKHRDLEIPLDRVTAVSKNIDQRDSSDVKFDIEDTEIYTKDGEEILEINVTEKQSIKLFINTDYIEFYQGTYRPPVIHELPTLRDHLDKFHHLTVRTNSEIAMKVMESVPSETTRRDVQPTEVILQPEADRRVYVPEDRVMKPSEKDDLAEDVRSLSECSSMPDEDTKREVMSSLENGNIKAEEKLKILDYVQNNRSSTLIRYGILSTPEYLSQVARVTNSTLTPVPQNGWMVISRGTIPDWIQSLSQDFPDRNYLTNEELIDLQEFVDIPSFVDLTLDISKELQSKEILLRMYENQEIPQDKIVSCYLSPWGYINPTKTDVRSAIQFGEMLKSEMRNLDEKYELDLYKSVVKWKQKKIYRRSDVSS